MARSPLRVARDVATAFSTPARFAVGAFRTVVGALLLVGSALLVLTVVVRGRDFVILETLAILAGLAVDELVGPELRKHLFDRAL